MAYRNRYMDPALGRFVSRDPIGLWGAPLNLGNGYTYAASNPWTLVDPMGLESGGNQTWREWFGSFWDSVMGNDAPPVIYESGHEASPSVRRARHRGDQAGNDSITNYFITGDPTKKSAAELNSAVRADAKAHLTEGAADGAENGAIEIGAGILGLGALDEINDARKKGKKIGKGLGSAPILVPSGLGRDAKDTLRAGARDTWETVTGRRPIWDKLEVHHRIPLEWSHIFPRSDPNRLSNLVGIEKPMHSQVTVSWNAWRRGLNGRIPTQSEVMEKALHIDEAFESNWVFPK